MVLVRVINDHDLVLEFSGPAERKRFLAKLENFLQVRMNTYLPAHLETWTC